MTNKKGKSRRTISFKKYTKKAQLGNKGEAFFESLVSDYCLPHRIVPPKDLGLDFICEWVFGEKPTGILFGVQIKTVNVKPKFKGIEKRLNGLSKYKISHSNLIIKPATLSYWEGLGIPIYLFAVVPNKNSFNCFYKRFTPVLTAGQNQKKLHFYKVNDNQKFIAYKLSYKKSGEKERGKGGFARDLYIDYTRWNYHKGMITYLNPRKIGLMQFPTKKDTIFKDLFREYKKEICATFKKVKKYLDKNC